MRYALIAASLIGVAGCSAMAQSQQEAAPASAPAATAAIRGADGGALGTAEFREGPSGVLMQIEVEGLAPGWHGAHFHAVGRCDDAEFKNAGGHINHQPARPHGLLNPDGPDMGDLANLYVGADGRARAEIFSALVSLRGTDGRPGLLDEDGSALVIHAGRDDHVSQPIGGAGDRVACGVIAAPG